MKPFFVILFIISFFSLNSIRHFSVKNVDVNRLYSYCPPNHEKAEETLKKYLEKEKNIEELRKVYNMNIESNAKNMIYVLKQDENKATCKKLTEKFEWLSNFEHYSFYKVDKFYFIVTYSLSEKDEFQRKGISIINDQYERLAIIIDIDNSY